MLLAVALGLPIGLSLGLLGGGGAVLAVPVLVYAFGLSVHAAATGALAVVTVAAVLGAGTHARAGTICWRHVRWFVPAASVGAIAGTALAQVVGGEVLLLSVCALMAGAALVTWKRGAVPESSSPDLACPDVRSTRTTLAGAGAGILTGFSGVGGGFLLVPTLALLLDVPVRRAIATSLVVIAALSAVALGWHLLFAGIESGATVAVLAAAAGAGSVLGGKLSASVPSRLLARGFALLLITVAGLVTLDVLAGAVG